MTDRNVGTPRSRKSHRAAGSRKVVAAVSVAATAGLMFSMAAAQPAWTTETDTQALPEVPEPVVAVPATRSRILLPIPPAGDGSVSSPTVAPALPQPVQLDPVAAPTQVVTKTVVVQRSGGAATTKSNGSR